jgi:hypothetical protein
MMKAWIRVGIVALAFGAGAWPAVWAQGAATATPTKPAAVIGATTQLGGQTLQLNGKGIRYRAFIQVYEVGLYASTRFNSLEQFLAAPGAKRIQLITLRELTGDVLGVAMVQGMQNNAPPSERAKLVSHMGILSKAFGEQYKINAGTVLTIDYVPGQGTLLMFNGEQRAEPIADPLFFPATARIWLGPNPVDRLLKDALLGIDTRQPKVGG